MKQSMKNLRNLVLGACLVVAPVAFAERAEISFHGTLQDANGGVLVTRAQVVEFRIYTSPTGGTPVWGKSYNILCNPEGQFDVLFSENDGATIIADRSLKETMELGYTNDLYVGMTVEGSGEMSPRQKIGKVPSALVAHNVREATENFDVEGKLVANQNLIVQDELVAKDTTVDGNIQVNRGVNASSSVRVKGNYQLTANYEGSENLKAESGFVGPGTIPVGGIIMWTGSSINLPEGWAMCNGFGGSPDLSSRFIRGASQSDELKTTGGQSSVTLTVDQIPSHEHSGSNVDADKKNWAVGLAINSSSDDVLWRHGNETINSQTDSAGNSASINNMPPYYKLCYIIRIK